MENTEENTNANEPNPFGNKTEQNADFMSLLIKIITHPAATGIGGYFLGQYLESKKTKGMKKMKEEVEEIKKELKLLNKQISELKKERRTESVPGFNVSKEEVPNSLNHAEMPKAEKRYRSTQLD